MSISREIRSVLIRQGKSLNAWARGAGYAMSTVRLYLHRADHGHTPRGTIANQIFNDLERDTGVSIPRRN